MPHDPFVSGILQALDGLDSRDRLLRVPGVAWELRNPGWLSADRKARTAAMDAAKRAILGQCAAHQPCYLVHHDDPPPESLRDAGWVMGPHGAYQVPASPAFEDPELAYWLFDLGNWQMWVGPPPSEPPRFPDTFRTDPEQLERWLRATGYAAFIDSSHDDDWWLLFVSDTLAA